MISTLNIAKCLSHYIFGNNTFMTIRPESRTVSINVFKCYPPAIRSYSSEFNQEDGKYVVKHDPVGKEFLSEIAGLGVARIRFERHDQLIILKHTDVPNQLSGRGIGKILAKEALAYVAKNDLQLKIQCPFIRHFVSKYEPKYIKYIKK